MAVRLLLSSTLCLLFLALGAVLASPLSPQRATTHQKLQHYPRARSARGLQAARKKSPPPPKPTPKKAPSPSPPPPSTSTQYDVVIIGAGVSGLAAASELAKARPSWRVQVVEARDRIGGRAWTVPLQGGPGACARARLHGSRWVCTPPHPSHTIMAQHGTASVRPHL